MLFAISGIGLTFLVIGLLLLFFGLMIVIIIFVKRKFTSLQIKKEELTEEEIAKQELDRILVPIDEDLVKKEDKIENKDAK